MKTKNLNRIRLLRTRRGWSQSELAEHVGAHWVTISKLERGQMQLTQEWMERLGHALGADPAELVTDLSVPEAIAIYGQITDSGELLLEDNRISKIRVFISHHSIPEEV